MRKYLTLCLLTVAMGSLSPFSYAQKKKKEAVTAAAGTIESFTSKMEKSEGYFNYYWDEEKGKVYVEISSFDNEFLYVNSLAAGVGSNDIGLDRGQLGTRGKVVRFEKRGPKVLMIQPNYRYRAVSDNKDEVKSVREAFASSVLWGFAVKARTGTTVLVDFTDFLLRDSHGIAGRMASRKQGTYKIDKSRSALYKEATFNFPMNTEFEAILTFTGTPKGGWVRSVTPSPDAVTVRTHHSLIALPDDDYQPRKFDPRSGFISISYQDYATPIESSLVKRFIVRHRLEKKDPGATLSEAVEPVVYYLDRGAPEPVRSALLDGARWWNQAFEAAGFKDAFRVEILPEDAHPLDVRYNLIQWVHRSTRGWSYGSSVVDPRTGEIIKGHVSLGSLRVRQDFLIAQGLLNQYDDGTSPMKEMALARIRQLSAHEVGHTLGLVHNYASSLNNRASVMDYPHPYVKIDDAGNIDLSEVYDTDIGEWDKAAIRYGYADFADDQDESEELKKILQETISSGLLYITDRDARARTGAHPVSHLWDNGAVASDELNRMMTVRRKVLNDFSDRSLPTGEPYSSLEEILVPMYLFHRYQVEATCKVVGGINYTYSVKGDDQIKTEFIPADQQINALDAVINTMTPEALRLSEEVLSMIPPKAHGYSRGRETFTSRTGPVWDYYGAIETAVQFPMMFLLDVQRANRLVMYNDRDSDQPGLHTVLDRLIQKTWKSPSSDPQDRAIQRIVEWVMLEHMMMFVISNHAQPDTKSITRAKLIELQGYVAGIKTTNAEDKAHYDRVLDAIERLLEDPEEVKFTPPLKAPDGSPIGMDEWFEFCTEEY